MRTRVLVTGQTFPADSLKPFQEQGYEVERRYEHMSEDELIQALQGKDAYIIGGVEFASTRVMESASDLKVIAVLGVGYQTFVDVATATKRGIAITNTPHHANARATAEMTIGMLLALRRKIPFINRLTKTGRWPDDIVAKNVHQETLGIIGMGIVGNLVAEIAHHGLGMQIIYHSRTAKPEVEHRVRARKVPLQELLSTSDIVSLHCPLTEETRHLISATQLSMMKKDALLINTARARLVDPRALKCALCEHTIAGCAMDGYYIEPAPPPEQDPYGLLELRDDNFLITSHLAYLTEDSLHQMSEMAVESVIRLLSGKSWRFIVNQEDLAHRRT